MRERATAVLLVAAGVAVAGCGGGSTRGAGAGSPPAPVQDAGGASDGGVVAGTDAGTDAGTPGQPPAYSLTDLGGGFANLVDGRGRVAGFTCDDSSCSGAVFTAPDGWNKVPVPSGAVHVEVMGIDAAGRLALNVDYPATIRSTYSLPYRWPPLELVPILATDAKDLTRESRLAAMNPAGHLVGRLFENATSRSVASGGYFYDGTVTRIAFGPGQDNGEALALNSRDQVVGWVKQGVEQHAFLWEHGVLHDLGTVSGASSMATAINDSGVVTGWGGTSPFSGVSVIFRWDGEMHSLGCPAGTVHCEATAINARGDIVGQALTGDRKTEMAFLYRDGAFHRLDDLVQGAPPGWRLILASSINDAGQIAGTGMLNGIDHGYLLTPR